MAKKEEGFLASVSRERKKIQWPDRKTLVEYTLLVIVISVITALLIWILDMAFGGLLNTLLEGVR